MNFFNWSFYKLDYLCWCFSMQNSWTQFWERMKKRTQCTTTFVYRVSICMNIDKNFMNIFVKSLLNWSKTRTTYFTFELLFLSLIPWYISKDLHLHELMPDVNSSQFLKQILCHKWQIWKDLYLHELMPDFNSSQFFEQI